MAIARPVRALGLAAIIVWCLFLYHMFRPSVTLSGGGASSPLGKIENMERDPMNDRMLNLSLVLPIELPLYGPG